MLSDVSMSSSRCSVQRACLSLFDRDHQLRDADSYQACRDGASEIASHEGDAGLLHRLMEIAPDLHDGRAFLTRAREYPCLGAGQWAQLVQELQGQRIERHLVCVAVLGEGLRDSPDAGSAQPAHTT